MYKSSWGGRGRKAQWWLDVKRTWEGEAGGSGGLSGHTSEKFPVGASS